MIGARGLMVFMQTVVFELLHARHTPDLHPQQLIELSDLRDQHVHQVVGLTGRREALQDGRVAGGGCFELRVPGGIDGHVNECVHPQAETLRVELRTVAADQSAALERSHALPARGLRQPDLLPEISEGHSRVVLEQAGDLVIDLVHRSDVLPRWLWPGRCSTCSTGNSPLARPRGVYNRRKMAVEGQQ